MVGNADIIGSYNTLNELWIVSTYQKYNAETLDVVVNGATNATPIVLSTATAHGIVAGQKITISGVEGNTAANGSFIASSVTPTTITLGNSSGNGAYTTAGS